MTNQRKEIQRLIEMVPTGRLPILHRIVRWCVSEGSGRELIWDPDEVALIRETISLRDTELFFDTEEADQYLRHMSERQRLAED